MSDLPDQSIAALRLGPPLSPTSVHFTPRSPAPITAPLLVWLLLQVAAVLIAVGRVPLSAQYPQAGERLAIYVMLTTQIGAAALLMPMLLRDWRSTAAVVATGWPMLALSAALSSVPPTTGVVVGVYAAVWAVSLAIWRSALPSRRGVMIVSSIAALWAVGGALLCYLQSEFTAGGTPSAAMSGPIVGAMSLVTGERFALQPWGALSAWTGAGCVALVILRRMKRRLRTAAE